MSELISISKISFDLVACLLVISIPTFFILRWFFKKLIKDDRISKLATWLFTIIATPIIYYVLISLWIISITYYPQHDFTEERWNHNRLKRYELSNDIIKSEMLMGKTKADVAEILGSEGNTENRDAWSYNLGIVPGLSIDPEILEIEFINGKVESVSQHKN